MAMLYNKKKAPPGPVVTETPSYPFNLKPNVWMQFASNMFIHLVMCRDSPVL